MASYYCPFFKLLYTFTQIKLAKTRKNYTHGLNQDDGQYVRRETNFWKPMLSHLREKSLRRFDVIEKTSTYFLLVL